VPNSIELTASHEADVMGMTVRRALPRAGRRTVGAWCFVDHMGPLATNGASYDVAPHPHIGLQTVTWLFAGEALHRDSLGSEQPIRPGQLNLMTAGRGVVHSEEGLGARTGVLHGVQLWVAQPDRTRDGSAAFEHHGELPTVELGTGMATILVGSLLGATSPARRDTDHVGYDLSLDAGTAIVPLDPNHEHAIVVFEGAVEPAGDDHTVVPGHLAYLPPGRAEIALRATGRARLLLIGGAPFDTPVVMWWNFVARERTEIEAANAAWRAGDDRFGDPGSALPRVTSPDTPWRPGSSAVSSR
jgi:hypothetical protein